MLKGFDITKWLKQKDLCEKIKFTKMVLTYERKGIQS